jgi:uncharacterized protein (TIGR03382 family)
MTANVNAREPQAKGKGMQLAGLVVIAVLGGGAITAEAATLTSTPTSVTFGKVQVGTTAQITLNETANDPTLSLTIAVANANFVLHNVPLSVSAMGSAMFEVECATVGVHSSSITVSWTDSGGGGTFGIPVSCNAPAMWISTSADPFSFTDQEVGTTSASQGFAITNNSGAAAQITNITTAGAECIAFSVSSAAFPISLAPDASTTMSVNFTPSFRDSHTCTLTVVDDVAAADNTLGVIGTGRGASIQLTPADVIAFGNQPVGTDSSATTMTITNNGDPGFALDVTGITMTGDAADFTLGGFASGAIPPGGAENVTITFAPGAVGARTATLRVNTSEASGIFATTDVTGTGVTAEVAVTPASVDFGPQDVQAAPVAQDITFANTGTVPLEVSDLVLSGTGAASFAVTSSALPFTITPASSSVVQVTYTPSVVSSGDSAVLRATTDAQGGLNLDIPLAGRGIDRAIFVSTTQLEFPPTYRNTDTPPQLSFDVQNTGEAALSISMVAKTGGGENAFQLVDMVPATIGGTSTETVVVEFSPASGGDFEAALMLTNDDDQQPMVAIGLSGQGRVPNFASAAAVYDMGRIDVGTPTRLTASIPDGIRFVNMEPRAFTVSELRLVDQNGVAVDPSLARVLDFQVQSVTGAETYTVDVELTADLPGNYELTLEVFLDADPDRVSFVTIRAEAVEVQSGGGCDAGGGGGGGAVVLVMVVLLGLGARRRPERSTQTAS